jgi:transposase
MQGKRKIMSHIEMYAKTLRQISQLERELAEAKEQLHLCNIDQFTTAAELADAVAKERERCAKIVEQYTGAWDDEGFALAAKIRKGE